MITQIFLQAWYGFSSEWIHNVCIQNSHISHRSINKFTGCVPSFNVSVVEDEIGSKNSYRWNIVLELLKLDISVAKFVKSSQTFPIISGYVTSIRSYLKRLYCNFVCVNVCSKMLIFLLQNLWSLVKRSLLSLDM